MNDVKYCTKCETEKSIEDFWKQTNSKDGLHCHCIACSKLSNKVYREKFKDTSHFKETHQKTIARYQIENANRLESSYESKKCSICKDEKTPQEFWKNPRTKTGLYSACIECVSLKNKEYRKKVKHTQQYKEMQLDTITVYQIENANRTENSYESKKCTICGFIKTPKEFWKNSRKKDGLACACIECSKPLNKRLTGRPAGVSAPTIIDGKKKCTKCDAWKFIDEFYKRKGTLYGQAMCIDCDKKKGHAYKEKIKKLNEGRQFYPAEKYCCKCSTLKIFTEFNKNNSSVDGLSHYCARCSGKYNKPYIEKRFIFFDTKFCTKCKQWRPLDRFYPEPALRLGVRTRCIPCDLKLVSAWRIANPDHRRVYYQQYKHTDMYFNRLLRRDGLTNQQITPFMFGLKKSIVLLRRTTREVGDGFT